MSVNCNQGNTTRKTENESSKSAESPKDNKMGQVISMPSRFSMPASSQDKTVPTWGSNLVAIRDKSDENSHENCKIIPQVENTKLCENLRGVEQFVEEFQKGVLDKSRTDKGTQPSDDLPALLQEYHAGTLTEDEEDTSSSEESSIFSDTRSREVQINSNVEDYLRQMEEYKSVQRLRRAALEKTAACPAKAGIPVTTPKPSPIPKRRVKFSDSSEQEREKPGRVDSSTESEEDEYMEWERRLKHVQRMLDRSLKRLKVQKKCEEKAS